MDFININVQSLSLSPSLFLNSLTAVSLFFFSLFLNSIVDYSTKFQSKLLE